MAVCKKCGAKIIWGITTNNKKIPLDVETTTGYLLVPDCLPKGQVVEQRTVYRPHFASCSYDRGYRSDNYEEKKPDTSYSQDMFGNEAESWSSGDYYGEGPNYAGEFTDDDIPF